MKKLLLVTLFTLLIPTILSAHTLKVSNDIGLTIHVSPDDDPVAGKDTDIFFEIKDKNNKFNFDNCECKLSINKDGTEVNSQTLQTSGFESAGSRFNFPEIGVYQLNVTGKPTDGSFNEFDVTFDLRVDRKDGENNTNYSGPLIFGIILIASLLAFFYWFNKPKS